MRHIYHSSALLLTLFVLGAAPLFAQAPGGPGAAPSGRITGSVMDGDAGGTIASATVAVWNAGDSTLVTGAMSDPDGKFAIEGVRPGDYYVRVTFVGYQTKTISDVAIRPGALAVDLGQIQLATDTALLSEVEVSGERAFVEMAVDRTVYNTKDQIASQGGSATDVLRNVPSIEVDSDGKVSLRGNQNVAILINGRPAPASGDAIASFLQGLPASSIDRVEIMPNPSARYDPDGMAGIVNIILKENTQRGLNGTVTLGAATHGNYNGSGSLNYMRGKLNLFGNYGFRRDDRAYWGNWYRESDIRRIRNVGPAGLDSIAVLTQGDDGGFQNFAHSLNATADYALTKQNALSFSALVSVRPGEGDGENWNEEFTKADQPLQFFSRTSRNEMSGSNMEYKLGFRRVIEATRNEFNVELRAATDYRKNESGFLDEIRYGSADGAPVTEGEQNLSDASTKEGHLQMDYVRPLGGRGKLETGYKGTLRSLDSEFLADLLVGSSYQRDLGRSNTFVYDEQVHGAYGIVSQSFGKFESQIGLRAEQALTDFDLKTTDQAFENNYFSLFPSAFLVYKPSDARSVKLSYSKRIQRPQSWALNPFQVREDRYFIRIGYPELKPQYMHALELGLTQFGKGYSVTATPYFRRTVDEIGRWIYDDPEEIRPRLNGTIPDSFLSRITLLTFENFDESDSYGFEAVATFQVPKRMNAFLSFNAYQATLNGSSVADGLANESFGWNTRANATFNLTPATDLQLTVFYRSPFKIPGGRIEAFTMTDVAVRQKLWGNKASLGLRVSDLFDTMQFRIQRTYGGSEQAIERQWTSRMAHLTFTYNFGQPQQNAPRRRPQVPQETQPDIGF